jgi:hypothetical protein
MTPSESKTVELSTSESRIVLQALGTAIESEFRALQVCQHSRPTRDIQGSIVARRQQIAKFEEVRARVAAQL